MNEALFRGGSTAARGDGRAPSYTRLEELFARLCHLEGAQAMLYWDWSTTMPPGGAAARTLQLATLESVQHELLTAPETVELLRRAADEVGSLGLWEARNLRLMERRARRAGALSPGLVRALAEARSRSEMRWRRARAENDFAGFLDEFAPLLGLVREAAERQGEALGLAPYDALIDAHEAGFTAARLDPLFDDLAAHLPPLIERILARQAEAPAPLAPAGPFPVAAQRALCRRVMERMGFEFEHGRLDVSDHPFCGGVPDDVRVTTRYDEADFSTGLMAVLHETGHALYERGLPPAWRDQLVGQAAGMAAHESQSLLIEMQVCRSPAFFRYLVPLLLETFAPELDTGGPAWTVENLARRSLRVARGLIRVEADEVTYPLHVCLRYRLEKALIGGTLAPRDLPAAWGEGMDELLGVRPRSDREGCLQDIHWAEGLFGYFPTYTLGALAAAQLFEAARRALPGLAEALAAGELGALLAWLRCHVHGHGSLYDTGTLIERASGRPLDAASFRRHIESRYLAADAS